MMQNRISRLQRILGGKDNDAQTAEIGDFTIGRLLWSRAHLLVFSVLLIGINRAAGLVWPYLSRYLVDDVLTHKSQSLLFTIVGVGLVATAVQSLSSYLMIRVINISTHRLVADLRKRVQQHVLRLSLSYYDANNTGVLVSRVLNDVDGVRSFVGGNFAAFLGGVLTAGISFVILMRIHAVMTLTVFTVYLLVGVALQQLFKKYRPNFRAVNVKRAELEGRLTESFGGVRVIKSYQAEPREDSTFAAQVDSLTQKMILNTRTSMSMDLGVGIITGIVAAVVTYLSANSIMAGRMTLGELFQYIMFLGVLVAPLLQAVSIGAQFNEALAGLERVQELLQEKREDHDASRSIVINKIRGEIRFDAVDFAYFENQPVLHNVSFTAGAGIVTALVGASGAGKSTITSLIAGFYKPTQGKIWLDDNDLSKVDLRSFRAHLGIVPQEAFLFSGTIRENVAFGRPDATDEEVAYACRMAHIDEFASRFADGYETLVGERGVKLSMGQRQRVAIARALLANPRILILDEATSSLDSISEAVIRDALTTLLQDRTTFVIAHRLSTIRRADQILVVDHGRVVEFGNHDSLLRARGKYWELYTTQYEVKSNLFVIQDENEMLVRRKAAKE